MVDDIFGKIQQYLVYQRLFTFDILESHIISIDMSYVVIESGVSQDGSQILVIPVL